MSLDSSSLIMSEKLLGGKSLLYDDYIMVVHIDRSMSVGRSNT